MKTTTLVCSALAALVSARARADTYTVTSLFDSGAGSLRSAVADANAHPGADTIVFHPSLAGVLPLASEITVTGPATVIGPPSRAVVIDLGAAGTAFRIETTDFGIIDMEATNGGSFLFTNRDKVRLSVARCVFRGIGAASSAQQAAVFNNNWLPRSFTGLVQGCSFINNFGLHAGVFSTYPDAAGEPLEFVNCTFAGNSSALGAGVAWFWGLDAGSQGVAGFTNCTITGNAGGTSGTPYGAMYISGNPDVSVAVTCRIKNSIVAENSAGAGAGDANFTGNWAGRLSLEGANIFAAPGLSPLQRVNSSYVRVPLPGSPCIDAAVADAGVRTDQVGTSRPRVAPGAAIPAGSDGADIGAVEVIPAPCAADFNRSGAVSVQDIFDFLAAYFAGCP